MVRLDWAICQRHYAYADDLVEPGHDEISFGRRCEKLRAEMRKASCRDAKSFAS
jgi:hypothetical protein